MGSCCHNNKNNNQEGTKNFKPDLILWGSLAITISLYLGHFLFSTEIYPKWLVNMSMNVHELVNTIWWGLLLGFFFVAILAKIPKEFVISTLGTGKGLSGIIRATIGGVLLDLCSHGILMVGAKLYERGATAGQVIAFLVASPWNSFSLTLILIALIGIKWTLLFIILSMLVGIISGQIFDMCVSKGILPQNPNTISLPKDFNFKKEAREKFSKLDITPQFLLDMALTGVKESRTVVKWIFFGVILASLVRTFVDTETFATYFGPTLMGLSLTIISATIIEVCSEGSTPIAADILTRAGAPGNGFSFLMAGVATDYTEIMILKETAKSWKFAFFLPLVTLPQVVLIGWIMNNFSV